MTHEAHLGVAFKDLQNQASLEAAGTRDDIRGVQGLEYGGHRRLAKHLKAFRKYALKGKLFFI